MTTTQAGRSALGGVDGPGDGRNEERVRSRGVVLLTTAGVAAAAALFFVYYKASVHGFGANSDGATVVLEGKSLGMGHLALGDWDLSFDSFWTIDAPFYALAVLVAGVRIQLLHAVPAFIALSVVVLGSLLAGWGRKGLAALLGALAVVVLVGLPAPILAFFALQGPWHIGTALWCVAAFATFSTGRFGAWWVLGVALLAAGLLGDLQMVALGVVPTFAAGLLAMVRARSWRRGISTVLAAPSGILLALAVRFALVRVGTFHIATGVVRAHQSQLPANFRHIATWGAALLGVGSAPIGPAPSLSAEDLTNGPTAFHVMRALGLVLVLVAIVLSAARIVRGVALGDKGAPERGVGLDDLLTMALLGDLAVFVLVTPDGNGDYARYLTAGVIFAAVLAGRVVARWADGAPRRVVHGAALVLLTCFATFGSEVLVDLHGPVAPQPAIALGSFLAEHHLDNGIGDYWSSSIVTVVTAGHVSVRPVITNDALQLVRYGRQSSASWYTSPFGFLVFDTARPWRKVDAASATVSFGTPAHTYSVGTYRVLVWSHPISVSNIGYSRD